MDDHEITTFPQPDDYRVTRFHPGSIFRVEMQMIRTRTLLAGVFVILLFLLPAPSQIARAQEVPCDNSQSESVIPTDEKGQLLMPEEIQGNPRIMDKLKTSRLTVKDIRRCLKSKKLLKNHIIDFDQYAAAWMEPEHLTRSLLIQNSVIQDSVLWSFKKKGAVSLAAFAKYTPEVNGKVTGRVAGQIQWHNVTLGPSFSASEIKFPLITSFRNSRFPNPADFSYATFGHNTSFEEVTFGDGTRFSGASFGDGTRFSGASFGDGTRFSGASFGDGTRFSRASFKDGTRFSRATFSYNTSFEEATFADDTRFDEATFKDDSRFEKATFGHNTSFKEVTFADDTRFDEATFGDAASFAKATFGDDTFFPDAIFGDTASFAKAKFDDPFFWKATFGDGTRFSGASFGDGTHFSEASFGNGTRFSRATFSYNTSFEEATFADDTSFFRATFKFYTRFEKATFGHNTSFEETTFADDTRFSRATFKDDSRFEKATFGHNTSFEEVTFADDTRFSGASFGDGTRFSGASFSDGTRFSRASFGENVSFKGASFGDYTFFKGATFADDTRFSGASFGGDVFFSGSIFGGDISLRGATFRGKLDLPGTTWEGRADLRETVIQVLCWNSTNYPSSVKGVLDAREAKFKKAVFKEIRFSDLVDFSDVDFGRSGKISPDKEKSKKDSCRSPGVVPPAKEFDEKTEQFIYRNLILEADVVSSAKQLEQKTEEFIFQNLIFEKEVDFLRATFRNDAIFVRNRFHSVWDLTGVTFKEPEEKKHSHLCLSFNRINKLYMERQHLGYQSSWTDYFFPDMLPLTALKKSRVRGVIGDIRYSCSHLSDTSPKENKISNENEDLSEIYKTIASSFREANDRLAENEAWYLSMVAHKESQYSKVKDWEFFIVVEYWVRLIFADFPSRYGIDLFRVVLVSVGLMFFFALIYWCYFLLQIHVHKWKLYVKLKPFPDQKRAFRFRPFERFFQRWEKQERPLHPLKDALFLSGRAFFKLGLGTAYPRTRMLVWITSVEWIVGMYMLIHFLLAVKNTLPIAVPFLAVAG